MKLIGGTEVTYTDDGEEIRIFERKKKFFFSLGKVDGKKKYLCQKR